MRGHLGQRLSDGLFGRWFDGDDERQVARVIARQLQYGFEADLLIGEDAGQARDNPRAIDDTESKIVGRVLKGHRNRLVFAQAFVREGRHALGTAAANFASYAHQVAHYGDSGGSRARTASIVERV